jgi:hypothetical protein
MAPWAVAAVSTTVAIFALVNQQGHSQPAEQPVIEAEAPPTAPPTAPEEQPAEAPPPTEAATPPAEPRIQAEGAAIDPAAPEPAEAEPATATRTGVEIVRGGIRMVELTNPRTGERYFRVVNRRRVAPPVADEVTQPEEPEEADATGEAAVEEPVLDTGEEDVDIALEPEVERTDEVTIPLTEDEVRRIVREEVLAQQREDELQREQDLQLARQEALAEFRQEAELSPSQTAGIGSILGSELEVLDEVRQAVADGRMSTYAGWMRADQARRTSERKLRELLGDRAYNLYHQRNMGFTLTGLWTMEVGNMQRGTTYWR